MKKKKKDVKITKRTALSAICAAAVLMNFVTLLFTVVRGGIEYLSDSELYYSNGYTLLFSGYPAPLDGVGAWLRVWCFLHFVISAVLLIIGAAVLLSKKRFELSGFKKPAVIISASLSLLYLVHGVIAYSFASDYAGLYYECLSFSYIPFIISAILTAGFFAALVKMPKEIILKKI